jgi:hypothetical protein
VSLWPTFSAPITARFVYELPADQTFRNPGRPVMAFSADAAVSFTTPRATLCTVHRNARGTSRSWNRGETNTDDNVALLLAGWELDWVFRERPTRAHRRRRRSARHHLRSRQSIRCELGEGQHHSVRSGDDHGR